MPADSYEPPESLTLEFQSGHSMSVQALDDPVEGQPHSVDPPMNTVLVRRAVGISPGYPDPITIEVRKNSDFDREKRQAFYVVTGANVPEGDQPCYEYVGIVTDIDET